MGWIVLLGYGIVVVQRSTLGTEGGDLEGTCRRGDDDSYRHPFYTTASSIMSPYCPSDSGSETSTVGYSHEPFTTYQTRVLDLVCALYGSETAKTAQIAGLSGGGSNRIIGITLSVSTISSNSEAVLRIPRSTQITHLPVGGFEITPSALDLIVRIVRIDHMDVAVQVSLRSRLHSSS